MVDEIGNSLSFEGVNKDFLANFGHPEDTESFVASSKLIMVRHA